MPGLSVTYSMAIYPLATYQRTTSEDTYDSNGSRVNIYFI
jgi:hypothetical protein